MNPSARSTSYLNINETFITNGGESLLKFRIDMKQHSLNAAIARLELEKKVKETFLLSSTHPTYLKPNFQHIGTQIGGSRPLSSISLEKNKFVTGSWSGDATLWNLDTFEPLVHLENGHTDARICSVLLRGPNVFTGDSIGLVKAWSYAGLETGDISQKISSYASFKGHQGKISQMALFPTLGSGSIKLCTASGDTTWRIWDLETESSLILQEGHSKDICSLDIHPDGALVATGSLDAYGIIWDVRIGRKIFTLKGHSDGVTGISFSSNGILIASGSYDGTAKIWDLRKLSQLVSIPAHSGPLTGVKFCRESIFGMEGSSILLTTGQDMCAKLWTPILDWSQIAIFSGHASKVMQGDISDDGRVVITVSYDRTIKLWRSDQ